MKLKKRLPRLRRNNESASESSADRITNDTVAVHREEVLSSARKYIYPLQHSKHRVVLISIGLFIALIIAFLTYSTLALYRFGTTSTFMYRVTQVMPFPVARAGSRFVAYENYLFELRHYMYYYENQQKLDFNSEAGQLQLAEYKKRALEKVVNDAYIKELADKHDVRVTNEELDAQIQIAQSQSRFGASEQSLEDTLKANFGWTMDDFRRSLKQQLLAQKVVATLDTKTQEKAQTALRELEAGADFAAVAKKYSDDPVSKNNAGEFGFSVDRSNRDLTPQTTEALFSLEQGKHSGIVNIGYALEIVKNIEKDGNKIRGAHILFTFQDINGFINDLKEQDKARLFISTSSN